MGASGALLLMIAYGRFSFRGLWEACRNTLETSSLVLFLAVASNIYGAVFTRLGTSTMIADAMLSWNLPPTAMLVALMAVIFVLVRRGIGYRGRHSGSAAAENACAC